MSRANAIGAMWIVAIMCVLSAFIGFEIARML